MIIKETNKYVRERRRKSLAMGCPFIYYAHIKYQVPSKKYFYVYRTEELGRESAIKFLVIKKFLVRN